MGWFVTKKNFAGKVPTWRGFICDTIADIATLPTIPSVAPSSECYCSENGITYILETDGDWVIKGGSPSQSSDVFVVKFYNYSLEDEVYCVQTYDEILNAFKQGKVLFGEFSSIVNFGLEDEYIDYKYGFIVFHESNGFIFDWNYIDGSLYDIKIIIAEDNTITANSYQYSLTEA